MSPLVKKLEERLLPEFEEVAAKIRKEIPNVSAKVSSFSVSSDEFLGHAYFISCFLKFDYS